jgi:hypothetical protein
MIGWRNSLAQNLEVRRCGLNAEPLSVTLATAADDVRRHKRFAF